MVMCSLFELLRYGTNQIIKDQTNYKSPSGNIIESKDVVKDLGILMCNNCLFKEQIISTIEKAKKFDFMDITYFYITII